MRYFYFVARPVLLPLDNYSRLRDRACRRLFTARFISCICGKFGIASDYDGAVYDCHLTIAVENRLADRAENIEADREADNTGPTPPLIGSTTHGY